MTDITITLTPAQAVELRELLTQELAGHHNRAEEYDEWAAWAERTQDYDAVERHRESERLSFAAARRTRQLRAAVNRGIEGATR